jgi:hypothetical protein
MCANFAHAPNAAATANALTHTASWTLLANCRNRWLGVSSRLWQARLS